MSMYREPNDRNPLNFDEVVPIGEKQKFRVGFTLIRYMSSIFATYVLRMMDDVGLVVLVSLTSTTLHSNITYHNS